MIDLDLWFPEDFDKRYAKYREKHVENKMPEPFLVDRLENERKHILLIKSEEDFKNELNKWYPLKIIVDAIYKELSPFLPGDAQIIKIDLSKLGLAEKEAGHIFLMLAYERVCRWKVDKNPVVITTKAIHEYMAGDGIVVPDYEKFQELRNKINDFYTFVIDQHRQKFPTDFPDSKSKALEKKIKEVSEDRVETPTIPLVEYNETTGKGKVNGTKKFRFKDGSPEHQIFNQLYLKLPKKVSRQDVLIAGGFYKDYEEPDPVRKTDETSFINDRVVKIREKTGLSTDQLVNNAGNLTLVATKPGKQPPKEVKHVAVWG